MKEPLLQYTGVILKRVPSVLLTTSLFVFSFWLMFHTFSYDPKASAMVISTKAWSDFGAHIPLIRSFSLGDNLPRLLRGVPPEYPLFPGEPIRYHFLFYSLVGMLEKAGLRIDWALNIPSALGFFLLMLAIYILATEFFRSRWVGILSVIFFLFNGSLSFIRFFALHPPSLSTLHDIITNGAFPSFAPWGPGDISAFWNLNIYTNQRHLGLAFGIALLIICLVMKLETASFKRQALWILPVAVLLGIFPYFHQPTLLILGIFLAWYFLAFPRLRWFLLVTGILAMLLVVPQVLLLSKGPSLIIWYPGYLIHDSLSPARFISYWWQNLGLHSIFIVVGFLLIPRRVKRATFPIFVIFLTANLVKFSVEAAAGHKFFNFSLILGNMLSAYVVITMLNRARSFHAIIRSFVNFLVCLFVFLLTFSGIIDFFPICNDPRGSLADIPANEAATWILYNTPPDSMFLNSSFFYNPASLAGRKIFLGWPYFAWSAGYDTYHRMAQQKAMLESEEVKQLCPMLVAQGIDYTLLETPPSQQEFMPNTAVFSAHFPLLFQTSRQGTTFSLYQGRSACPTYAL